MMVFWWWGGEEPTFIDSFIITSWAEFLNLGTVDGWGWIILCCGSCPVHGRMLAASPGLYLVANAIIFLILATKNVSRQCHMSSGVGGGGSKIALIWKSLVCTKQCCREHPSLSLSVCGRGHHRCIPIPQIRTWRLGEVESFALGHTANMWQNQHLSSHFFPFVGYPPTARYSSRLSCLVGDGTDLSPCPYGSNPLVRGRQ